MATTKDDIRGWFQKGREQGATHMIVICDTYDHSDYPAYVRPGMNCEEVCKQFDGPNMQRVMEVYALHLDLEAQLAEHRANHREPAPVGPVVLAGKPERFTLDLSMSVTLSLDQIWPDGDAPENPAPEDVLEALRDTDSNLFRALDEWNLEDAASLTVREAGNFQKKANW